MCSCAQDSRLPLSTRQCYHGSEAGCSEGTISLDPLHSACVLHIFTLQTIDPGPESRVSTLNHHTHAARIFHTAHPAILPCAPCTPRPEHIVDRCDSSTLGVVSMMPRKAVFLRECTAVLLSHRAIMPCHADDVRETDDATDDPQSWRATQSLAVLAASAQALALPQQAAGSPLAPHMKSTTRRAANKGHRPVSTLISTALSSCCLCTSCASGHAPHV